MTGQYLIHLLFGLSVTSTILYWLSWKRADERFLRVARVMFSLVSLLLVTSASLLIVEIVRHRFEYSYVYSYSSVNLPLHLLIASFYSGQEGSFLLWAMFVSIIGVALIPYAKKHQYEGQAMTIYGLILSFLTLLLIAKNPFSFYWETFAAQGITPADVPADGRGLNPLLHNVWITIHPPILFSGFAAMSVSFAFAMAGLIKRDYHRWIGVALPWTLFATAILGFGIMLGGFWAYETLGWGGFWGWDPVENSSLIPWLVSVALVHTMLVQKRTHGLVKTNMALAIGAFVMVLYSTFLTRSGVLGDTSVHSFVDPGKFAFWILLAFMLAFTVLGAVMLMVRRKDMNINRKEFTPKSREFMMSIGAALVMASALFVTVGTSWPVFMEIINQPKVAVAVDFYNKIHVVLVPLILAANGLALLLQWRHTSAKVFRSNVMWSAGISLVPTVVVILLGIRDLPFIILSACAWFSLIVNAQMGFRLVRRSASMAGAYISHLGIALLMFGIIATSAYTVTYHATLVQGVPQKVGAFTLTFLGREQVEKYYTDREKYRYIIKVERGSENIDVASVLYWSDFNRRESAFLEPGIRWGIVNDLYISPKATDHESVLNSTLVMKGGTVGNPLDSRMFITLERFTTPVEEGSNADGTMNMGALLHVGDSTLKALTKVSVQGGKPAFEPEWIRLPNSTIEVGLTNIVRNNNDPSQSTGELSFRDSGKPLPKPREMYTVDFSVKPLISLVWLGVITMVAGFAFSIVRYARLKDHTTA